MATERIEILKKLEAGEIDAAEAAERLAAIPSEELPEAEAAPEATPDLPPRPQSNWARFWIYPLMAGGAVLMLGSLVMALVYSTGAARGWLVCGWLPMILGLVIILLAWWSRRARWLHVRISEAGRRRMAFSLPLPLTLAAWALRIAQPFVPELANTGVDDLIIALRDGELGDEPVAIDVRDDQEGERVQVYIG